MRAVDNALMIALTLMLIELSIRTGVFGHTKALLDASKKAMSVLQSADSSDALKERAARDAAGQILKETAWFCAKLTLIAAVVSGTYWIAASVLGLSHVEFYQTIVSVKAMVGLTILGLLYIRIRHVCTG